MKSLPLYIARHLYGAANSDKSVKVSRPATFIAMLGIAIGIATMIVSVCVVLGFKHTVRDKVVGFGGHIAVSNVVTLQTTDQSFPINANDSLVKVCKGISGVTHVQRFSQKQGVLKTDTDFLGVYFKGVGEDYDSTFIASSLVDGHMPRFSSTSSTRQLLISQTMADKLKLKVGQKVRAYFMGDSDVRQRVFDIAGVYQTNMKRYDDAVCFADIYTISKLNTWQMDEEKMECAGLEFMVSNFDSIPSIETRVRKKIDGKTDSEGNVLGAVTIQQLSPQTFAWLDLLDLNVWIILALMIAVSGFTMISGLLIIILERSQMIGLMKALGARNSLVRRTFRWLAVFIVVKGMLWGNVLGIGICLLQQWLGIIKLDPATYYVSEVPVEINWLLIVVLNVVTLIITILTLVVPSFLVSAIMPARSMKIE